MKGREIMRVERRYFILLVTLAAAAPALGQTLPSGVPPSSSAAQNAISIPNFSGIWVHPYFPGFEPPASGPGPVVNKSRRRDGVGNPNQFVGDYTNPILKPQAAEVVRKHGEISLAGATSKQPVLALGSSLHFFPTRHADAATAGTDHFPLSSQS
jgi:hypothetical protein